MREITFSVPEWGEEEFKAFAESLGVSLDALFSFFAVEAVHASEEKPAEP